MLGKKKEETENQSKKEGSLYFGVKFRAFDKVYPIQKLNIPVKLYDRVVVQTNRGKEFGVIALRKDLPGHQRVKSDIIVQKVVRIAGEDDIEQFKNLEADESDVFIMCIRKNKQYHHNIRFFKVEKIFDGSRYIIYYKKGESDQSFKKHSKRKTNLQPLISDLTTTLQAKIEMREVGNRGEAKIFGGVGNCGRSLCCVDWNKKGSGVTVKMAKEQGLAINIPKLSGVCGRLICCLSYEKDQYQDGVYVDE